MNELALLSLLITICFTEFTGLSPGGIVVPFYMVLFLDEPVKIAATLIAALGALFAVRLLDRIMILYGRRRFAMYLIIGLLEKLLFSWLYFQNSYLLLSLSMTIGYLVPGILAGQMDRQGIVKTLGSLAFVVLLIRVLQIAVG